VEIERQRMKKLELFLIVLIGVLLVIAFAAEAGWLG
jgi:hypothetical protein